MAPRQPGVRDPVSRRPGPPGHRECAAARVEPGDPGPRERTHRAPCRGRGPDRHRRGVRRRTVGRDPRRPGPGPAPGVRGRSAPAIGAVRRAAPDPPPGSGPGESRSRAAALGFLAISGSSDGAPHWRFLSGAGLKPAGTLADICTHLRAELTTHPEPHPLDADAVALLDRALTVAAEQELTRLPRRMQRALRQMGTVLDTWAADCQLTHPDQARTLRLLPPHPTAGRRYPDRPLPRG